MMQTITIMTMNLISNLIIALNSMRHKIVITTTNSRWMHLNMGMEIEVHLVIDMELKSL